MQEENKPSEIKKNTNPINSGLKQIQNKPPQKKKKKISAAAIVCVVIIVLVIGAVAAVYFDVGGAKQIVSSLLKLEPANTGEGSAAEKKQEELALWEKSLSDKENELKDKEKGLDDKEGELNKKEGGLIAREAAVAEAESEADKEREEYLKTVADRIGKMDVKKAAAAIAGMDTTMDMAKILLYIAPEQSALIMNQMKSALATKILSEMMK